MDANPWYTIKNIDQVDSPALVIFPERVKENIRLLKTMIDDPVRLRPHVKTHKTREAAQLMLAAGIQKFKCATIAEAEMLAQISAPDVLLAYQPIGPKLKRFKELTDKYPGTVFSCLTDNVTAATAISEIFVRKDSLGGKKTGVYIDLNLGQNRTGIIPGKEAVALYKLCAGLPGITIKGLHAYDGHIRDKDFAERTANCNKAFLPVENMASQISQMNLPEPVIVAGGSPTFPIHAKRGKVECSPGTFIFWDKGYSDGCPEQPFLIAAVLLSRVISLPAPGFVCLDLGHKSVAAENELIKRVFFPDAPALKATGQSEEHLVLDAGTDHSFQIGDVLYGFPLHICPTVALYERAVLVEEGIAGGEWKIVARDRKIGV
jgi:D-threonine aldolase